MLEEAWAAQVTTALCAPPPNDLTARQPLGGPARNSNLAARSTKSNPARHISGARDDVKALHNPSSVPSGTWSASPLPRIREARFHCTAKGAESSLNGMMNHGFARSQVRRGLRQNLEHGGGRVFWRGFVNC